LASSSLLLVLGFEEGDVATQRRAHGGPAEASGSTEVGTLVAARFNPVIRAFYQRLRAAGKAKKVALVACMRKLLTVLNAMLKHRTHWRTEQPQHA